MAATRANKPKAADPDRFEATVVSPEGNEYLLTSAADYYNLRARGYSDKGNAAETIKAADTASSAQRPGPAEGTSGSGAPAS